jgi:hypothetical protein
MPTVKPLDSKPTDHTTFVGVLGLNLSAASGEDGELGRPAEDRRDLLYWREPCGWLRVDADVGVEAVVDAMEKGWRAAGAESRTPVLSVSICLKKKADATGNI